MVVSVRSCLVFLCLQVRLTGTFLPSFAASIADLNIEEEDARDKPEDLSEKEFFDKVFNFTKLRFCYRIVCFWRRIQSLSLI